MAGTLDGQVALVTGGSRGIGRAISLELASHGATVAVNYQQNKDAAEAVVGEIKAAGGNAQAFQGDQSNPDETEAMTNKVLEELGPVQILINNAGTTADRTLARMSADEWNKVIDTNVNGLFHVTSNLWTKMGEAGGGHVVCISSIVGETGRLGLVNYATSKAAAIGFVRAAAREGALLGKPSLAISQYIGPNRDLVWPEVAAHADRLLDHVLGLGCDEYRYWNANLPPSDFQQPPIVRCSVDPSPMGVRYKREDGSLMWDGNYHERPRIENSDVDKCFNGSIALTNLSLLQGLSGTD